MAGIDDLVHKVRPAAGDPQGALVLLHGRGADENDLFPLLDMIDPESRLIGVCPGGPLALPPGGRHWYEVRRVGYPDPETFLPTFTRLSAWLGAFLSEAGVDLSRTIIGGFSQGAVMSYSLALGPGRTRPLGLLAFSGFIPEVDGFELADRDLDGWPVAIGHGIHDPVITVDFGRSAKLRLERAGAAVTYRESPMAHTIDPQYLADLRSWVAELF